MNETDYYCRDKDTGDRTVQNIFCFILGGDYFSSKMRDTHIPL